MKFVLVMVLMASGRTATIQTEFNTWEACENTRKWIAADVGRTYLGIVTQGCHKKGEAK